MKAVNPMFRKGLLLSSLLFAGLTFAAESKYEIAATESKIIKFDSALQRALVANPDLATVQVLNAKELLVSGKQAGKTELIVWYRNDESTASHIVLDIMPDQSRKDEISKTVKELLAQLDPEGTVHFDLKNIWIDASSSVRRSLDDVGNQIDGDGTLANTERQDTSILQTTKNVGSLSITPIAGNYMVLLKGTVPNEARKKRIQSVVSALGLSVVNLIKVTGKNQIKLSVRVAEVSKGNPFMSGVSARDKQDRFGIFPPGNLGTNASFSPNNQVPASAMIPFPNPEGFQIGFNPMGNSIFGVLSIMEGHNLARVLAKPELIVQAGETATILVGGEIGIPVGQGNGSSTIEFKEYGIRLSFSPIITEDGKIQMTVAPEVSDFNGLSNAQLSSVTSPSFRSRKASTTITVGEGQSFVIGGLIQDNVRSSVKKVPILGDIPILGALFRSSSYEHDKSELAILVTPEFVEPYSKGTVITMPGENISKPSNSEAFFLGKLVEILPEGESAMPKTGVKIGLETVE